MSAPDRLPRPELAPGDNGLLQSRLILILLLADILIVPLALGLAFLLRVSVPFPWTQHLLPFDRVGLLQSSLLLALVTQLPLLFFSGLYEVTFLRRSKESVLATLLMVGFQLLLISAWFFFSGGIQFPRSVLLLFSFFNFLFLVACDGRQGGCFVPAGVSCALRWWAPKPRSVNWSASCVCKARGAISSRSSGPFGPTGRPSRVKRFRGLSFAGWERFRTWVVP